MKKIDRLLSEYGESHQNETNKAIHWICVPLIIFSLIGLLWSIPQGPLATLFPGENPFINWATVFLFLVLFYYFTLSIPLFLGMILVVIFFSIAAYLVDQLTFAPLWLISIIIFFLAWLGQFYGHKIEGKKPSFVKDIQFLLIGPAWLMSFIFKKFRIQY